MRITAYYIRYFAAELGLKTRKEIAEYLAQNKDDRARIKVKLDIHIYI